MRCIRFKTFLDRNPPYVQVPERGEQYVARRLVNAFTEHWYQHYAAERRAQLAARDPLFRAQRAEQDQLSVNSGPRRSPSPEEEVAQSW